MSHPVGAQEYPNNIFKQTTPDEEQALTLFNLGSRLGTKGG